MKVLEAIKDYWYSRCIWYKVIAQYPGFHNRRDRREFFQSVTGYYDSMEYYRNEVKE